MNKKLTLQQDIQIKIKEISELLPVMSREILDLKKRDFIPIPPPPPPIPAPKKASPKKGSKRPASPLPQDEEQISAKRQATDARKETLNQMTARLRRKKKTL